MLASLSGKFLVRGGLTDTCMTPMTASSLGKSTPLRVMESKMFSKKIHNITGCTF